MTVLFWTRSNCIAGNNSRAGDEIGAFISQNIAHAIVIIATSPCSLGADTPWEGPRRHGHASARCVGRTRWQDATRGAAVDNRRHDERIHLFDNAHKGLACWRHRADDQRRRTHQQRYFTVRLASLRSTLGRLATHTHTQTHMHLLPTIHANISLGRLHQHTANSTLQLNSVLPSSQHIHDIIEFSR